MSETQTYPEIESQRSPESRPEQSVEVSIEHPPIEAQSEAPQPLPVIPQVVEPMDAAPLDAPPMAQAIEHVLADGLDQTYQQLDPATQAKFKATGEETAKQITVLLQSARDQTKKILQLILNWLRIIPGVNQYFLEQEAKIKADRILQLRNPRI